MERILTDKEAETKYNELTDKDKYKINSDKIRFGEYFIALDHNSYYRVDPINVIVTEGQPVNVRPNDTTII